MRQTFNYHTHTKRCGHAIGEDEEYIQAAISAGFKVIGMSDHRPYRNFPFPEDRMNIEMYNDYISSMRYLREKYKDQIDIKIGFETEYYIEQDQEIREMLNDVDYMILGQHYTSQESDNDYFFNMSEEYVIKYAEQVCGAMDTGLFLYVAHPDYVMFGQTEFSPACQTAAEMIARKAVERNIPLEVNINGVTKGRHYYKEGMLYPYPFRKFWEVMSKYPIKCVYGFDSHDPELLKETFMYEEVDKILDGINLNFVDLKI